MDEGTDHANDAQETWGEDESKVFAEYGRAMVPGREEIERTFLDLIPAEPEEPFFGVEVGTGTEGLGAAVLHKFSNARILGLGGSPDMLGTAAKLLGHYGGRTELRQFRLGESTWAHSLPTARVFLSSLVLHHVSGTGKKDLFARLFERLEPGGALLFECSGRSKRISEDRSYRNGRADSTLAHYVRPIRKLSYFHLAKIFHRTAPARCTFVGWI